MNMHEPKGWQRSLHTPQTFADLIARGQAVKVTSAAKPHLPRRTELAVDIDVYERYVGWDSQAMREHGICLDEQQRLQDLVKASAPAAGPASSCFVCKAYDCRSSEGRPLRAVLSVTNYGCTEQPMWLIHQ